MTWLKYLDGNDKEIANYNVTPETSIPQKDDYVILGAVRYFIYLRIWNYDQDTITFLIQDEIGTYELPDRG